MNLNRFSPRHSNCYTAAFTLVELLMVALILSIVAAIAVPNILLFQTRSKVARVKSDLRTLGAAVEAYAVDNDEYPPVPILLPARFRRFRPLTTPISYISEIPRDPFQSTDPHGFGPWRRSMYNYGATPLADPTRWALASDGPDRHDDTNPIIFYPGYSEELFYGNKEGFNYTLYDPTNGTVSRGDIFRASDFIHE